MEKQNGFAEVDGGRLYYEVAGEGRPVILAHGGLVHSALWDGQFESFARHFEVIRYATRKVRSEAPQQALFPYHEALG